MVKQKMQFFALHASFYNGTPATTFKVSNFSNYLK